MREEDTCVIIYPILTLYIVPAYMPFLARARIWQFVTDLRSEIRFVK